ncbi:hypothetical protein GMOD_00001190 [Pyrenophora seminiperda CCB06]|uniref:Uncharacterized protein n=1 Tax=Pyrenophora seminiperda CCB06 TaxID=1302712 RepID=A0A3M7LYL0_9PLEO|nr:hypothetical protein GMOD_00001190 [Pyrenophora seminiperda CCB06]
MAFRLDVNRDENMSVRSHDYNIESPYEAKCESSSFSSLLPTSSLEVKDDYDYERKEADETRDSVLHLNDESTTTLARSFSFTPLPTPTRYLSPSTSLPRSASLMIDLSSNPFTQHSVPPTPISPTTIATQLKHRTTTLLYRIVTPSNLDFVQLIKRKPAPARGQDWVDQWNKLFAIQGTQGFGLRKVFDERKKGKGHRWVAMVGDFGDRIK